MAEHSRGDLRAFRSMRAYSTALESQIPGTAAHAELQTRLASAAGSAAATTPDQIAPEAPAKRLTVDLKRSVAILDGNAYDVKSELALRWLRVLSDRPAEWISGRDLENHDGELLNARTDRLKEFLPPPIHALVDSVRGKGSRIRL